ncbi:MAG: copper chaperone PCu(A)C, partial [Pseudomonadota bacterium]
VGTSLGSGTGTMSICAARTAQRPPRRRARCGHWPRNAWDIVEFHRTEIVDELSTMRREASVRIAPGDEVVFEPFGRHLMLMVPVPLPGDVPTVVTLCFADGECFELTEGL